MSGFGKKILSAFVDISDDGIEQKPAPATRLEQHDTPDEKPPRYEAKSEKFKNYFEQLFRDANLPGPDYYEFSKMIEAMKVIADERTRFVSAFAGLSVQGLDKAKLTESAARYIELLDADAASFNASINDALQEKVEAKKQEMEDKATRIKALSQEIQDLTNKIAVIGNEIQESEEKIRTNLSGYQYELQAMKQKISNDLAKINELI